MSKRRQQDPFSLPEITSPPWQTGTRLVVAGILVMFIGALLYATRPIIGPLVLAVLLAYLLHPLVSRLSRWTGMPRSAAVLIIYGILIILLAGATTGVGFAISQQVVGIVRDLSTLIGQLPQQLRLISESSYQVGPWIVDFSQVNLDPLINSLASTLQPILSRTGTIVASAVTTTATTVGLFILILVMGYYLLRDFDQLEEALLELAPPEYRDDFSKLIEETGRVWGSFLRGQLLLGLVMGAGSAAIYGAIGVRFALGLGLITGLMEFIPIFGPYLAGIVAVLLAFFQGSNWWALSSSTFALVVLIVAVVIQQIENTILVPRIIGHSLRLHPLVVLVAAIGGGVLAGFFGILLAAPTVATMRLWIGYLYSKTVGLDSWPKPVIEAPSETPQPGFWQRLRGWAQVMRDKREPSQRVAGGEEAPETATETD